ncbi:MAG: Crp/Fnr family transcriptional regulator [Candidatus Latescibacterota bacterium]
MKMPLPRCQTCDLKKNNLFAVLNDEQINRLDQIKSVREYQKGDVIFYENTPSFALYCVCSGWVKLYKVGNRAERQVIRLLGPGDVLGHRALLADESYSATAETIEISVICTIPKEPFLNMVEESPRLAMRVMGRLAEELRHSEEQLLILSQKSVQQRTAQMLLLLMRKSPEKDADCVELRIPLRRNEMAQMIGTTPESLSRTLRQLSTRGILRVTRTDLCVLDKTALARIAGSA